MQPTTQEEFTMFINLILQSAFLFAPTGIWDPFALKSAAEFGLVFFQVMLRANQIIIIFSYRLSVFE